MKLIATIRALTKLLRGGCGSQIAEAALVMPIAFTMLLGIYWFGRAFNTYATITHAAREGARAAVTQSCASCNNLAPSAAYAAGFVTQALQASAVDPSQIIQYPATPSPTSCPGFTATCGSSSNITFCNHVQLTAANTGRPAACGVSVSFQYPYQFWLPFTSLNNQQLILTADVQMQGEY